MAGNQVTKIYELKTLGYDELIRQLTAVETKFKNINDLKKALKNQRIGTQDADDLIKINQELEAAKLKTIALKLEKQNLTNAKLAEANATKAQTIANNAEANSYNALIAKQKELYAILKNTAPGNPVQFQGKVISFDQAIAEYKKLVAAEQAFRRQFQADAVLIGEYTTGIVNAFKAMGLDDLVGAQAQKATARLKELDLEFEKLKADLTAIKANGGSFDHIEQKLIANRNEAAQLNTQLKTLQVNLGGVGSIGNQITTGLANGFNNLKNQASQLLLTYVGFFAAFNQIREMVKHNAELSDSFANLQIRIHGTSEDVEELFEGLKKLDTRTSLAALTDIAAIVAKKGVTKEEIIPLTKALDDLFVVLGKEIGEPSEATASIIKLISIFNKDGKVTAERVKEIGTEIFKLTTSGVATGAFLVDFAERVGAVRGITGLTLPNILGMGAALEQLGQHVEVAGTASIQLTTKLFSNVPKFAAAAKVSVEEFRRLLKDNPFDALVATAEGLANLSDEEIATNFEEVTSAFGEVQVTGARVKAVLGEIATNGGLVQEKMRAAAVTTKDYSDAVTGTEIKQKTFAATLERIKKQFEVFGTNQTVRLLMIGVATVISTLIGLLPVLLSLLGLLAIAWTVQNAQLILLRAQVLIYNLSLATLYITQGALYVLQAAYIVGLYAFRAALFVVTAAARLFNVVLAATPLGFLLTGFSLLVGGYAALAQRIDNTKERIQRLTQVQKDAVRQAQIETEVRNKASEVIKDQIANLQALVSIVTSEKTSYDTARIALDELITKHHEFGKALQGDKILLDEVKKAMTEVTAQISLQANAQAAAGLSADKFKEYLTVVAARQKVERFLAVPGASFSKLLKSLTDEEKDLVITRKGEGGPSDQSISFDLVKIKAEEEKRLKEYEDFATFSATMAEKLNKAKTVRDKGFETSESLTIDQKRLFALKNPQSADELEALIEGIDKERGKLKEGDPKLADLARLRDLFQKRLDVLNNKKLKTEVYRGAKLSGETKDELNEIEARMRTELAMEETRFATLQLIEGKYHDATYDEEVLFTTRIKDIYVRGLNDKIKYFEDKGKLNAKEQEQLATFRENLAKTELKYVKDINNINERQFNIEAERAKKLLDAQIAQLEEANAKIQADPNVSEETKARAKKEQDDKILIQTEAYYLTLDLLANKYAVSNLNIEERKAKARSELIKKGFKNDLDITEAMYKDIILAGERHIAEVQAQYGRKALAIIDSNKAGRDKLLEANDRQEQLMIDHIKVATAKIELELVKRNFAINKATKKQVDDAQKIYSDAMKKLIKDLESAPSAIENINQGLDGLAETISKFFNLPAEQGDLLSEAIIGTFQIAEKALDNFFNKEYALIQRSLDINLKRLDIEKDQRKDRAQSRAEEISIDKQFDEKKRELEKAAFERNKKLQMSQLAINFAVQLSNIALAAAQNPTNAYTYGAAGLAQYAIQAAIATALYFLNRANLSGQTFAMGGRVKGKTHTQGGEHFMFRGRVYEDEVDEINIVRTRNANENKVHTIQGTHSQIASKLNVLGGGIEFAPGARKFATGGFLGTRYPAPTYVPSSNTNGYEMINVIRQLADEQAGRIDRIEVVQVTGSVTNAQKKQVRQQSIGTF